MMDLQYFADNAAESAPETGAPEGTDNAQSSDSQTAKQEQPTEKTFTQAQVDEMVQKRLARYDKDHQREVEDAKTEAIKYARMNKDEKAKHDMEQLQAERDQAKQDLARYQMRDEVREELIKGGYHPQDGDIDMIVAGDADTTAKNTKAFLAMVERIHDNVRNELLKGDTPKAGGTAVKVPDEATFKKMSYTERLNLKNENPDLYQQLIKKSF